MAKCTLSGENSAYFSVSFGELTGDFPRLAANLMINFFNNTVKNRQIPTCFHPNSLDNA